MASFPLGHTWREVLHSLYPDQWETIQIKAVGRWAAQDRPVFEAILQDYLAGPPDRLGRNLKALIASILQEAGGWIWPWLQTLPAEQTRTLQVERLTKLLPPSCVECLPPDDAEALAQWLRPYVSSQLDDLAPLLNALADRSTTARQMLQSLVNQLSPRLRQQMGHALLRFQPIDTHPALDGLKSKDQRFLIHLYRQQAADHPAALAKLMAAAQGKSNDAAVAATHDLLEVSGHQLDPADLLPLLDSRFPGVRINALVAIAELSEQKPIAPESMEQVCQQLSGESSPTVVRYFYDLATAWVKQSQQVSPVLLKAVAAMLGRLVTEEALEGGLGRSLVALLKAIGRSEDDRIDRALLGQIIRQLLTYISVTQIKNGESEAIDALCAMHRLDASFLSILVNQDLPVLLEKDWLRNVSTIIKAARRLEGPQSPVLDEVSELYDSRAGITNLVLEARGL